MGFITQNVATLLLVIIGAPSGFLAIWQFNIGVEQKYFITSVIIMASMFLLILVKIESVKEELLKEVVKYSGKKSSK